MKNIFCLLIFSAIVFSACQMNNKPASMATPPEEDTTLANPGMQTTTTAKPGNPITNDTANANHNMYIMQHYKLSPKNTAQAGDEKKSVILAGCYDANEFVSGMYSVNIFVSGQHTLAGLVDTLVKTVAEQNPTLNKNTQCGQHFDLDNVTMYKYISVTLIDPDTVFRIIKLHDNDRQLIDTTVDIARWQWSISPQKLVPDARLIVKVTAERPGLAALPLNDRIIAVKIKLSARSFGDNFLNWFYNNIAYIITVILIPGIAFLLKRWFTQKDSHAGKDEPADGGEG